MDKALIDYAANNLTIAGVYLRASHVQCNEDFTPPLFDSQLSLVPQYRSGPTGRLHKVTVTDEETGQSSQAVLVYFSAGARLADAEALDNLQPDESLADDAVYVEIECEFSALYNIDESADKEKLEHAIYEFGRYNVGYHVWPYWREYVQGVCARVGIPPIPVPMYRIPNAEPENPKAVSTG
jgi:hypothetical protein